MRWQVRISSKIRSIACGLAVAALFAVPAVAQKKAQASNMQLLGFNDLQGRNGYIPTIQKQGDRWIAYIAHHNDKPLRVNSLTGKEEPNGTSIVDVTDVHHPKYLYHIP